MQWKDKIAPACSTGAMQADPGRAYPETCAVPDRRQSSGGPSSASNRSLDGRLDFEDGWTLERLPIHRDTQRGPIRNGREDFIARLADEDRIF